MAKERTYIMIKPDGVQRGLVGEIIKRFEQRGYKLVGCKASDQRTGGEEDPGACPVLLAWLVAWLAGRQAGPEPRRAN